MVCREPEARGPHVPATLKTAGDWTKVISFDVVSVPFKLCGVGQPGALWFVSMIFWLEATRAGGPQINLCRRLELAVSCVGKGCPRRRCLWLVHEGLSDPC